LEIGIFGTLRLYLKLLKGLKACLRTIWAAILKSTHKDICNGDTGHAEVIQLEYDAEELSFNELLLIFFKTHNPTTLKRQEGDVGT
jgi:peptide-methionine (S)-S-oxide reductase